MSQIFYYPNYLEKDVLAGLTLWVSHTPDYCLVICEDNDDLVVFLVCNLEC